MTWTKKDWALAMAKRGFWVFRLGDNDKLPRFKRWQNEATTDPAVIGKLWSETPNANIGIFTSKYANDSALMVVDVDNKNGKNGSATLTELEDMGFLFPATCRQMTPTNGQHIIYRSPQALKQSAGKLGHGLDTRSRGGYIVAAGSTIDGKPYTWLKGELAEIPGWLYTKFSAANEHAIRMDIDTSVIDQDKARQRAEHYIFNDAPVPVEGERNDTAFRVAATIRDMGVNEDICVELMTEWNEACEVPLSETELETTIGSCYKTAQNSQGYKSPEVMFSEPIKEDAPKEIGHPFDELNKEYAFVLAGGGHHILWETTDEKGRFKLQHLQEQSFHRKFAWYNIEIGKKIQPVTKLWLCDKDCRRYDGLVFRPQQHVDERFYNMWRGFAYEPVRAGEAIEPEWQIALDQFIEHALVNVCNRDQKLFDWLMGFFAHMIQRPWDKPMASIVFKGRKGVGKNALLERVGALLGPHFMVADDDRYLISNFNAHLESCLFIALDEAFWSGDKHAEGKLKGLITGSHHNIEMKGLEIYRVDNLTRVAIIGNEKWLVPATEDERRYAVFDIGEGRRQDVEFFTSMKRRMEAGGYRLLLSYLMNYDISKINVNLAPVTMGLIEQKHASLEPFDQWWFDCLTKTELIGGVATAVDFKDIGQSLFRSSFQNYARQRQIRSRLPDERTITERLARFAPSMRSIRLDDGQYIYRSDGIHQLRKDWERYIGLPLNWNEGELECLT